MPSRTLLATPQTAGRRQVQLCFESIVAPTLGDILDTYWQGERTESKKHGERVIHDMYQFASDVHAYQKRKSGANHLAHTAQVGYYAAEARGRHIEIAAGLGHDTIEDYEGNELLYLRLIDRFGKAIAREIDFVTKPRVYNDRYFVFPNGNAYDMEKKEWLQLEYGDYVGPKTMRKCPPQLKELREQVFFTRLISFEGLRSLLLRCFDEYANLRDVDYMSDEKQLKRLRRVVNFIRDIVARLHYGLLLKFDDELRLRWPYELKNYETSEYRRSSVLMLPPLEELDYGMIRRIPVRIPGNMSISIYGAGTGVRIGLPQSGNGRCAEWVKTIIRDLGGTICTSRSALHGFNLDAKERMFRVDGLDLTETGVREELKKKLGLLVKKMAHEYELDAARKA